MKIYKPNTPGQRGMTGIDYSVLTKKEPEKALLVPLKQRAGRAKNGRITVRHQGGGVKRMYRLVEFGQPKIDIIGKVVALEYDPNRTAFLALVEYPDKDPKSPKATGSPTKGLGEKLYILAPQDLKVGFEIAPIEAKHFPLNLLISVEGIFSCA